MKDRSVEFPGRYYDVVSDRYVILTPAFGVITQAGSVYNKANVLPQSVCNLLGIADHVNAEPKDAFAAVASGRYYGKMSKISGGNSAGSSYTDEGAWATFSTLDINGFSNIVAEASGRYMKIPVPLGAKTIKVTASCNGARATFGTASYTIYLNDTAKQTTAGYSSSYSSIATTVIMNVAGDGTEYVKMWIQGEQDSATDEHANITAEYLMLEVTQ